MQAAALEERCQQLRVAAAERDYDTLTADCSKRERDAAALEPFPDASAIRGDALALSLAHVAHLNRRRADQSARRLVLDAAAVSLVPFVRSDF